MSNTQTTFITDETGAKLDAAPIIKTLQENAYNKAVSLGLQGAERQQFIQDVDNLINALQNGDVSRDIYHNLNISGEFGKNLNNKYKDTKDIQDSNEQVGRGAKVFDGTFQKNHGIFTSKGTAKYRNKVNRIGDIASWVNTLIDEQKQVPQQNNEEETKQLPQLLENSFVENSLGGMQLWQTWKNNNTQDQKFDNLFKWVHQLDRADLAAQTGTKLIDVTTKLADLEQSLAAKDMHATINAGVALGLDMSKFFGQKQQKKDAQKQPSVLDTYVEKAREELGPGLSEDTYIAAAKSYMEDTRQKAQDILDTRHKKLLKTAWDEYTGKIKDTPLDFDIVDPESSNDLDKMRDTLGLDKGTKPNSFWLSAATKLGDLMDESLKGNKAEGNVDLHQLASFFVKCYNTVSFPIGKFDTKNLLYESIPNGKWSGYVALIPTSDNGKYCVIFDPSNNKILQVPIHELEGTSIYNKVYNKFKEDFEKVNVPKKAVIRKNGGSLIPKFLLGGDLDWKQALLENASRDTINQSAVNQDTISTQDTVSLNKSIVQPNVSISSDDVKQKIENTFQEPEPESYQWTGEGHKQHFFYKDGEWDFTPSDQARVASIALDFLSLYGSAWGAAAGIGSAGAGIWANIEDYKNGDMSGFDAFMDSAINGGLAIVTAVPGLGALKLVKDAKVLVGNTQLLRKLGKYAMAAGMVSNAADFYNAMTNILNNDWSTEDLKLASSVIVGALSGRKQRITNKKLSTLYDPEAQAQIAKKYPDITKDIDTHYELPTKNGGRVRVSPQDVDAIQQAQGNTAKNEAFHRAQVNNAREAAGSNVDFDASKVKTYDLEEHNKVQSPLSLSKPRVRKPIHKEVNDSPIIVINQPKGQIPYIDDDTGEILFLEPLSWKERNIFKNVGGFNMDKWLDSVDNWISKKFKVTGKRPTKIKDGVYELDGERYIADDQGRMLRETPEAKNSRIQAEQAQLKAEQEAAKLRAQQEAEALAVQKAEAHKQSLQAQIQNQHKPRIDAVSKELNIQEEALQRINDELETLEKTNKLSKQKKKSVKKKALEDRARTQASIEKLSSELDGLINESNSVNNMSVEELEAVLNNLGTEAFKNGGAIGFARFVLKAKGGVVAPNPLTPPSDPGKIYGISLKNGVARDRYTHGLKEALFEAARRLGDSKYGFDYYNKLNQAQDDFAEIYQGNNATFDVINEQEDPKVKKYQENFHKAGWNDIMIWPFMEKNDYYNIVSPQPYAIDRKSRPNPVDGHYAEATNHRTILGVKGDWEGKDKELQETVDRFKALNLDYYLDDAKGVYKLRPLETQVIKGTTYKYDPIQKSYIDPLTNTKVEIQKGQVFKLDGSFFVDQDGKKYTKSRTGTMVPADHNNNNNKNGWLSSINWGGVGETLRAGLNIAGAAAATKASTNVPIAQKENEYGQDILEGSYQDLKEAEKGSADYRHIAEANKTSDATQNAALQYEATSKGNSLSTIAAAYDANKFYDSRHKVLNTAQKYRHLNKLINDDNQENIVDEAVSVANAKANLINNTTDTISNIWSAANKLLMENVARKQQLYNNYLTNRSQNLLASAANQYARQLQTDPIGAKNNYDAQVKAIYDSQFKDAESLFNNNYWMYTKPWTRRLGKGSKLTAIDQFILQSAKDFNKDLRENNKEYHKDWRENRRNKRKRK